MKWLQGINNFNRSNITHYVFNSLPGAAFEKSQTSESCDQPAYRHWPRLRVNTDVHSCFLAWNVSQVSEPGLITTLWCLMCGSCCQCGVMCMWMKPDFDFGMYTLGFFDCSCCGKMERLESSMRRRGSGCAEDTMPQQGMMVSSLFRQSVGV